MADRMVHWNGNQLCVIDTETTGLDPYFHEIIQLCILPLDSEFHPRQDVLPFYIEIAPQYPERIDQEAMKVNKLNLLKITQRGHDPEKAKDLLDDWFNNLKLPLSKWGTPKKILPLGQNFSFDSAFMKHWLGIDLYNLYFDYHFRDTMSAALFMNDHAAWHNEKVPFSKVNLAWLCSTLKVSQDRAHDALQDCVTTAEVYRRMLSFGLIG